MSLLGLGICIVPEQTHFGRRGYGATAARLTPDQKVGSSNLSALICLLVCMRGLGE